MLFFDLVFNYEKEESIDYLPKLFECQYLFHPIYNPLIKRYFVSGSLLLSG